MFTRGKNSQHFDVRRSALRYDIKPIWGGWQFDVAEPCMLSSGGATLT
jgi:hypothetical protein